MNLFGFCVKTLRLVRGFCWFPDSGLRPTGSAAVHVCPVKSWTSRRWNKHANRPGNTTKLCKAFIFWFNRDQIELFFFWGFSYGQFFHPHTLETSSSFCCYPWRRCCFRGLSVPWGCLRAADLFCVLSVSCCSLAGFIVMVSTFSFVFFSLWPCRLPHQSKSHENPASNQ